MLAKEKIFLVSSNVDDSIRNSSSHTDIVIFKTFKEFEEYVDKTPISAVNIIVNSNDLLFTSSSVNRLVSIVNSSFVSLSGSLYYMVDDKEIKSRLDNLCDVNGYDKIKCLYSDTLYAADIADVISGESLSSRETVTVIKTYRVRAEDYIRSKNDKDSLDYSDMYSSDEDDLAGIVDEEVPDDLRYSKKNKISKNIVASDSIKESASWIILKAQYLALTGRVLIVERDTEYHTILDILTKIGIDYEYFDVSELYRDCYSTLQSIRSSKSRIVFVGSRNKVKYNYFDIISILASNLEYDLDYYIYETSLSNLPYGSKIDIVLPTTVPDVLRGISNMSTVSDFNDIIFVGLDITNFGAVSLTETEFSSLIEDLLQENILNCVTVKINGLLLREEVGLGGVFMHR